MSEIITRSEDINAGTVVGEVGTFVTEGGSANRNGFFCGSGRVVASITVIVT